MQRIPFDKLVQTRTKDALGNVSDTREKAGVLYATKPQPLSHDNIKEYGWKESSTHQIYTRDELAPNSYLKYKQKTYYVNHVENYMDKYNIGILELK